MNMLIIIVLAVSVLQAGAESREEEIKAQIREHQSALNSLQSQLDSILSVEYERKSAVKLGEMEKFLRSVFPIDNLSLGKARISARCCKEQYGVYVAGQHLADTYSTGYSFTTKYELADSVYDVLKEARLINRSFTFVTPTITPEADSLLRLWGGGVNGAEIDYGEPNSTLVMDANCQSVSITAANGLVIVDIVNHDGSRTPALLAKGKVIMLRDYYPAEE